jgi:uncharacterized protein with PQ loop repeat
MIGNIFSLESRVWSASFFNVLAMLFQLNTLLRTGDDSGLSLVMLVIFFVVQLTFAEAGYKTKMWGQFWGMLVSAVITATIMCLVVFVY